MDGMKNFPYEFTKPLLLCFNLLKRCNIGFFDDNVPFFKKYWRFFFIIPFVLIHYITFSVYMSRVFTNQIKMSELAFMVPVYLIFTQGFLKAAIVIPKKSDMENLIKQLGIMWRTNNLNNYQTNKKNRFLKQLNLGHAVFYWGSIIAAWQNMLAPLVFTLFRKFVNEEDTEFLLPFGCVYPFDPVKNWMRYITMYTFQTYTMFRVIYVYIGTEFVMITLCAHLSIEFALLREDLKHIKPRKNKVKHDNELTDNNDNSGNTIKSFIQNHQKLIE
ncbi:unnamed protein product [Euphydryas editha]|uniref:Uncharacterized protein n=1 Tax=Euphydryas editha TaxID=104508 RepID=A0AAU9TUY0_EUPED|nr:unnamed protein product [Euphydryas editha]